MPSPHAGGRNRIVVIVGEIARGVAREASREDTASLHKGSGAPRAVLVSLQAQAQPSAGACIPVEFQGSAAAGPANAGLQMAKPSSEL